VLLHIFTENKNDQISINKKKKKKHFLEKLVNFTCNSYTKYKLILSSVMFVFFFTCNIDISRKKIRVLRKIVGIVNLSKICVSFTFLSI